MIQDNLHISKSEGTEGILLEKLKELKNSGFLNVTAKGNGRFGLTIEEHLGIAPNCDRTPDFLDIELKTKIGNSLQTLFSLAPTKYTGCSNKSELISQFGRQDEERERLSLFTTFGCKPNNLGFSLSVIGDSVIVKNMDKSILEYKSEKINDSLLLKHKKTAYIKLTKCVNNGVEQCKIDSVFMCKEPSITLFLRLVELGKVNLEFSMYIKNGKLRDYGFSWRIRNEAISYLYLYSTKLI